jgi:hypothetical protein
MQGTLEREGTGGVARAIVGIVLLILIAGVWACLWVPPWPIF